MSIILLLYYIFAQCLLKKVVNIIPAKEEIKRNIHTTVASTSLLVLDQYILTTRYDNNLERNYKIFYDIEADVNPIYNHQLLAHISLYIIYIKYSKLIDVYTLHHIVTIMFSILALESGYVHACALIWYITSISTPILNLYYLLKSLNFVGASYIVFCIFSTIYFYTRIYILGWITYKTLKNKGEYILPWKIFFSIIYGMQMYWLQHIANKIIEKVYGSISSSLAFKQRLSMVKEQ